MHTIRLRGPWELEPVHRYVRQADGTYSSDTVELPAGTRMKMPADWSAAYGADFLGRVRYRRVFHRPTGLEGGARVYLVVEPARSDACITLEQALVGFVYPNEGNGRFEITDRLDDDNVLEIIVDHPGVEVVPDHPERYALRTVGDAALLLPGALVGEVW